MAQKSCPFSAENVQHPNFCVIIIIKKKKLGFNDPLPHPCGVMQPHPCGVMHGDATMPKRYMLYPVGGSLGAWIA